MGSSTNPYLVFFLASSYGKCLKSAVLRCVFPWRTRYPLSRCRTRGGDVRCAAEACAWRCTLRVQGVIRSCSEPPTKALGHSMMIVATYRVYTTTCAPLRRPWVSMPMPTPTPNEIDARNMWFDLVALNRLRGFATSGKCHVGQPPNMHS